MLELGIGLLIASVVDVVMAVVLIIAMKRTGRIIGRIGFPATLLLYLAPPVVVLILMSIGVSIYASPEAWSFIFWGIMLLAVNIVAQIFSSRPVMDQDEIWREGRERAQARIQSSQQ